MKTLLILTCLLVAGFAINGIGLNPIKPYHLNKGKLTKYLFQLVTEQQITSKAKIQVTFPAEFDQSAIASNPACMASSDSYSWKSVPCSYINGSIVLTLGTINDEQMSILIQSPQNPTIYSMSSYFSICLMFDSSVTNCKKQFGKVVFPDTPTTNLLALSATTPNVTSLSSLSVGKASTYQFKFSASGSYAAGNTIRVTLPVGYTTTVNPVCQMTGTYNQIIKTFVWPNQRSIQCQLVNKTISTNQVIKIIGIYNPTYAGIFGNSDQGFIIQILKGTTTAVLQQLYLQMTVTIKAGDMAGSILQSNRFIKAKAKYTFYLNIQNALDANDYIQISMSNSWVFYNNQCAVVSGIKLDSISTFTCTNSSDSTYTYLKIYNFVSASITNQLVFNVHVGTPLVVGTYPVNVITGNSNGIMDQLSLTVSLNQTYGSLDMLSINAITANSKVPVAGTGPLELTFFLNYQLPQTNVLTQGKFILKIYPQIVKPPQLINGVLKCYFFNNVPATTCTWVNLNTTDYTLVTITTPITNSFQYSQIPITITTEGAVNTSMVGITIDDKVTRYRFELSMYKQDSSTIPTQVYYSQYIADPILLTLTNCISLTKEIGEYTSLRIQFDNPYTFTTAIMSSIRLKIQFLNGGGWADNLGYTANTIYKRYPCVFYYNDHVNASTYDSHVACDLYTYLTGPHASLTDSSTRGPYILMYGFTNTLNLGQSYRLELPKFLIGSTTGTAALLRVSIIQQTSTMLTKYIQLYYNQLTAFTTVSKQVTTISTSVTSTLTSSLINAATTHTNAFTAPSIPYAVVYQYDVESTPSFTNRQDTCSTARNCYYFGDPVNWVIQYPTTTTPFTVAITSKLALTNGKYGGTYGGIARSFSSTSLTTYKGSFNIVYIPRVITTSNFYLSSSYLYKGSQMYFYVNFYPITSTPDNGFIRLTFGSGVTLATYPYCSSTTLSTFVTELGLLCINENTTTLKIYNIKGLVAGTLHTIYFRLKTDLTASTITPTIKINTYYNINVDYSMVDEKASLALNTAQTNYYTVPYDFSIQTPKITQQTPRVNYIGSFSIIFRPTSVSLTATKISVDLPNHSWNGGIWTTPNGLATDPMVCFINSQRVDCTYTLSPFKAVLTAQNLLSGSDNTITLTTQYLPKNGIKHPAQGGQYLSILTFLDNSSTILESTSFYHKILAQPFHKYLVTHICSDTATENMFTFDIMVQTSSYPRAYADSTMYSRVLVQFPTVDSLGNTLFRGDLGGYTSTGEYVGCYLSTDTYYVVADSNYLKCRLIKPQVSGDPAVVEVLNLKAFSSSAYRLKLVIAKVFNPVRSVASVPISIRINNVQVSNNDVYQLYYDTFDLFLNSQTPSMLADTSRTCLSDFTQDGSVGYYEVGDIGYINFYPLKKDSTSTIYLYALKFPSDFTLQNVQNGGVADCTYHHQCMIFPQIGYVVVNTSVNSTLSTYYISIRAKYPSAISQANYNIQANVWQNLKHKGYDYVVINSVCNTDFMGTFYSNPTFTTISTTNTHHPLRIRHQVKVDFYLRHSVPYGGTIQIKWPSTISAAYPHCRSMVNLGSTLYAKEQPYNGQVGCLVQATNTWVITQFATTTTNARIIIMGFIDIGSSSGYFGTNEILSYNSTHATDIRTNGFVIDYYSDSYTYLSSTYIYSYNSMNIDTEISLEETLPLRVGYTGGLRFKFMLGTAFQGPNIGKIAVRLPRRNVYGVSGGFGYDSTKKIVCQLKNILTHEEYGCVVSSVTDDTTSTSQNINIIMFSSSSLLTTATYTLLIRTYTGVDPEGLTFPTVPGNYKVDVSFDVDGSGTYLIHDHLYLQVYGTSFTLLSVKSFVTLCGQRNLIWVKLTPTTTISATDSIVIEIPTASSLGTAMFANDLGTGIIDGGDIPIDIVDGSFANGFMTCRLYKGDQTYGKPVKIVCGGFTQSITSSHLLYFGFKVYNPSVSPQASIPFFIYSLNTNLMYKSNFNVVENAVYLRNTFIVSERNYYGNIISETYELQTSSTYIELTARNTVATVTNQDYYLLFFSFPLRKNGIVSSACKAAGGGSIYGNAYYHYNLWVIVCDFTVNSMGVASASNSASQTLRIEGFYSPWYYLPAADQIIYTYHLWSSEYSYKGILTDGFPIMNPKTSSSATFTLTPIHQSAGTLYKGARDDYTISFSFSSTASVDISYMKKIAIIFPASTTANYILLGQDCVQDPTSSIQIAQCWVSPGTRIIWIRPVIKSTYTSDMTIAIRTRDLAIRNPTNVNYVYQSYFIVKFYSWENMTTEPTLDPINNNYYCFLSISNLTATLAATYTNNPSSIAVTTFNYFRLPHQRHYKQIPYNQLTHYAPLQMIFKTDVTFPTVSGANYHTIRLYYGAFTANSQIKIRDLQVYRPMCYLANNRVRKCTLDTTNSFITMNFQFGLTISTNYHILFSITDPRNPDVNGFLPTKAVSDFRLQYLLAGSTTIYYTESQKFPTLYSLPTGTTQGPFRGIIAGTVEYGHALTSQLNVINLKLTFNRTDITGLLFQIPLKDGADTYLFTSTSAITNAFLAAEDGAPYPCGNNGYSAGGNVKCFIKTGVYTDLTIPTRIFMTDFTYVSQMNCRFLVTNPETAGAYFSIKVKAFGGTKTSTNIYGDKFMGEWDFSNIFMTTSYSGRVDTNSYVSSNYRKPTKSPWRNDTIHYVFSRSDYMYAGQMSIAQVLLYDSGSSYSDKQYGMANLISSASDYEDLLHYTTVISGQTYKYAYFVKTWTSQSYLYYGSAVGWGLSYIKLKFYAVAIKAYWFYSDTSIEIATNSFNISTLNSLETISGAVPTNPYFDHTVEVNNVASTFTFEIDITTILSKLTDLQLRDGDNMVMSITFNYPYWTSMTSCNLLGGLISTSLTTIATCVTTSSAGTLYLNNFKGFIKDPILPITSNYRVKVMFIGSSLIVFSDSNVSASSRIVSVSLYANYDAYYYGYTAIVTGDTVQAANCFFPSLPGTSCYYSNGVVTGSLVLQQVSDTFVQFAVKTSSLFPTDAGASFYLALWFYNFNYGSTCTITNVKLQISSSTTPGSGTNNTLAATSTSCTGNKIQVSFSTTNISAIWGGLSSLANDYYLNTTDYIIAYFTITPSASMEMPTLHHDYIYAYSVFSQDYSSTTAFIKATSYLANVNLCDAVTLTTISDNRGGVTQLAIQIDNLYTSVGSSTSGYVLLAQFIATSAWTDPFLSYTNSAITEQYVECKCLSAVGSVSITTTSPYVDAVCKRRMSYSTFTNFAIIIDFDAAAGYDVKCYFPQFKITAGTTITAQMKVVYNDSYPPDMTGGYKYGSVFRKTSNTLTFTATTPVMPVTAMSAFTESPSFYSAATTIGSTFNTTYTLTGSWGSALSTPYVYINFGKGGPIAAVSFCADSNIFLQCRVYRNYVNVIIARIKSTSSSSFTMTRGSSDITYPVSQWSDSSTSLWYVTAYIGTSTWTYTSVISTNRAQSYLAPISSNTFLVYNEGYHSARATFNSIITICFGIAGKTLYKYTDTKSQAVITFSGLTQKSNCQIWVQNEPTVELTCIVATGSITVYSERTDYTTSNLIFITLGITNPQTASTTFTLKMYDYYYSSSRYSLVISKTAALATDNTYSSNVQVNKQKLYVLPFQSRYSLTGNAPLRVRFQLTSSIAYDTATPSYSGAMELTNAQFAYSSAYLCTFRQYTAYANMAQSTQYIQAYASAYTISGTVLTITPPKSMTINASYYYQLIVMPIGISTAGCTAGLCASQAGFQQVNFQMLNVVVYSNYAYPTLINQQVQRMYKFEGQSRLALNQMYILGVQPGKTSLYLKFSTDFNSTYSYPYHYLQFIFWDLTVSAFSGYSVMNQIPCQLSSTFTSVTGRQSPTCVLSEADNLIKYVKVRIINIGPILAGTYY